MAMSNANLAATIKRAAANTSDIIKKKARIKEKMGAIELKQKEILEAKLAKLKEEYDDLSQQQEIFEKPIREFTGGYSTEDLVKVEIVETGTDKNGKPIRKTLYELRYPDTILPPSEVPTAEGAPEEATRVDVSVETDDTAPTDFAPMEPDDNEMPFSE